MNPHYKLGFFSRRTLRSLSRAIAPVELGVPQLEDRIIDDIERQLRCFPNTHRWGFILGLCFVEWGAPLGGWGVIPLSWLQRERATSRLYQLLHSRLTPVRLFMNGARVLICLSAYGHPSVEERLGFNRLAWRAQRRATRQALLRRDGLIDSTFERELSGGSLPPTPEALYSPLDDEYAPLLDWKSHELIASAETAHSEDALSPFGIEDFIDVELDDSAMTFNHPTSSVEVDGSSDKSGGKHV